MIWKKTRANRRSNRSASEAVRRRFCAPEMLEARRLMAADPIHVGVVYLETDYLESDQDVGGDSQGDRFILSFTGGAEDTELSELRLITDKDGDGISVGDPLFDTQAGGRGKDGFHDFQIVRVITTDGRRVDATAEVSDGGQELVLRLSNFKAGDRLEFTLDVDEVLRNAVDLAIFNDRLDVITSGQEFQDSILQASFNAPHYETAQADAIFLNDYGDPASERGLNLPADDSGDIDSRPNRSAAAVATTGQVAKPIDIAGHVWIDSDLDAKRESGEQPLVGIEIALWKKDSSGSFEDTGFRATTDNQGRYLFSKSLGMTPGTYRIVETQPEGYFSVAAVPGTVAGVSSGRVENDDVLTDIEIPLGDTGAVDFDFAEAHPASLSGFVYIDRNNDGEKDASEQGIAGVRVQLVPIHTIAQGSTLTVTTAADGSYTFTGLAPGTYEVIEVDQPDSLNDGVDSAGTIDGRTVGTARNPGDRIIDVQLGGGDSGIDYNFGETPFGSLAGFVYLAAQGEECSGRHDDNGNLPLEGVRIELQNELGVTLSQTTTGTDGSYRFEELSIGNYRIVEFTPAGLIDGEAHAGRMSGLSVGQVVGGGLIRQIAMPAGGVGTEYNFCEGTPATLSGYVYHDQDDDGRFAATESAIENAEVRLYDTLGKLVATARTDSTGLYEFRDLAPGDYEIVQVQPIGYLDGQDTLGTVNGRRVGSNSRNDVFASLQLKQGNEGIEFNFGELFPASLSGRVHVDTDGDCVADPDEERLAGVTIRLFDTSDREVARTQTDNNGRYTFADLVPGTYSVLEEQPDGYFEGDAHAGSAGGAVIGNNRIAQITLESGENAVEYDFCEQPPAEISGNVFADRDGNCLFHSTDRAIEGVLVELFDATGTRVGSTVTDARGNYRFTGLRAGNYTLRETQPDGYLQGSQRAGSAGGDDSSADRISQIPLGWGERITDYNFCELEPASLSGSVHVDGNGDCIRDDDEPALQGVVIQLRDSSGKTIATTTTDTNGRYHFNDLVPGDYQIFEEQPDGYFQGGQTLGSGGGNVLGIDLLGVSLSAGQVFTDYDYCELAPSSISGRVWLESNPDQVYQPGDQPIPGVLVELLDQGGNSIDQVRTDAQGNYQFETLAPGVYGVRETQPSRAFHGGQVLGSHGGQVGGADLLTQISLVGGTEATQYNFPEVPPASITGYVFQDGAAIVHHDVEFDFENLRDFRDGERTRDDKQLSNVTLELRNVLGYPVDASRTLEGVYFDGPIQVTTDAQGYYEFTGLRPGSYHVYQVQPDDFIDGLDTPGSTGGIAVNPADDLAGQDRIIVQSLAANAATDPQDDAILNIQLVGGQRSEENNFSEIVVTRPDLPPLPLPETEQVKKAVAPIESFDPRIRLVAFAIPETVQSPIVTYDEWAVTWHLSVINAGFADGEDADGILTNVRVKKIKQNWTGQANDKGMWVIANRKGQLTKAGDGISMGADNATALTGDFDGDGFDEAAIFVGGNWFIDLNGNGRWDTGDLWIGLGTALDRPVVGDWDGDGKDDVGIFGRQWNKDEMRIKKDPGLPDPDNKRRRKVQTQTVAYRESDGKDGKRLMVRGDEGSLRADAVDHVFQYGEQADTPIAGDWNGDGIDQIAVFRGGTWMLDVDGDGRWTRADEKVYFGRPGDEPIVGDFNGDGIDEIGVVRGDRWIIDTDGDRRITGNDLQIRVPRQNDRSQPIVGDFDGDGEDEPGYYDESA